MKPPDQYDAAPLSLAAEEQIDALCMRFEKNWKAGQPEKLEELLHGVADRIRAPLLRELLRVEIHHRRLQGETPVSEEYVTRFPDMEAMIRSLLPPPGEVEMTAQPAIERVGGSIGPYKLLQKIGEGGMGSVYVAEQEQPVRRKVALKIIKPGMDTEQVDRPVRGRTPGAGDDGPPQHRQGPRRRHHRRPAGPTSSWNWSRACRSPSTATTHKLTPARTAGAVHPRLPGDPARPSEGHHPPRHQAVQRPGDALHDGKPVPKVIDFGIAKAIDQRLTERTRCSPSSGRSSARSNT